MYQTEQGNLNGHDQLGHIEGNGLLNDSVWQGGQNANISDIDGEGVDMVGHGRTIYQYQFHGGDHVYGS